MHYAASPPTHGLTNCFYTCEDCEEHLEEKHFTQVQYSIKAGR